MTKRHFKEHTEDPDIIRKEIRIIKEFIDNDPKCVELRGKGKSSFLEYQIYVEDTFPEFNKKYPTIVKKLLFQEDLELIELYFTFMNKIRNNELDQKTAEKQLGEMLANKYLYPKLNKK